MRVKVTRSRNSECFYVIKSVREGKKTTTKVVERLGTRRELEARLGEGTDVEAWCRARAAELTEQEKGRTRRVTRTYDPTRRVGGRRLYLGGHVFVDRVLTELGVGEMCRQIASRHRFSYDLESILRALVCCRALEPDSKLSTCALAGSLIHQDAIEPHDVYRALSVLAEESDFVQEWLYRRSARVAGRKTGVLYFDCTNYFFEAEREDDFRRYGVSKEHRPSPIVQMGLFMDAGGMPLAFCLAPGNSSEQPMMVPLEERIVSDFGLSKFVVCTDAGLSSLANREFNSAGERQFVTATSPKKLKAHLKRWALDRGGWRLPGSEAEWDLDGVDESLREGTGDPRLRGATFYKARRVRERDASGGYFEQTLVATFSFKYRDYQRRVRADQVARAERQIAEHPDRMDRKGANDFRRLCRRTAVTGEGEVAERTVWAVDEGAVAAEAAYDGVYCLATSFLPDDDVEGMLAVNARRWEIEECFRIMKTEFEARPVYLRREDRIRAHFLTCFMALLAYRIVEGRVAGRGLTCDALLSAMRGMLFEDVRGEGWAPLYEPDAATDALHEAFGFRTDYEIIPYRSMRRIFSKGANW